MSGDPPTRARDEHGQATVLIVGLAVVIMLTIALVVDASAAFLQRQGLNSLADGAALSGADAGAEGTDIYLHGVGEDEIDLVAAAARAGVRDYLHRTGAYARYPGLTSSVRVFDDQVVVHVSAPLDLPLHIPGAPARAKVGATGSAVVLPD